MKKFIIAMLAILGVSIPAFCQKQYTDMNPDEFEKLIGADSIQLVDVRTADEYKAGHIANAINIDVKKTKFMKKVERKLDKNKTTAVYCRSGHRSGIASEMMSQAGFKVINLVGGIKAWTEAGKSTTTKK